MASIVFTGTATGHKDLLLKIKNHLTDVSLGTQKWVVERYTTGTNDELFLRGPGLSASDSIYINIRAIQDIGTDVYNWEINSAVAYDGANSFTNQPACSPLGHMNLWDSAIPYWVIVNGRRFIVIAKISTTYQSMYGGFYLPYATSSEMPYPICMMSSSGLNAPLNRWSVGTYQMSGFWDPIEGSSYVRHWNGSWVSMENLSYRNDTTRSQLSISCIWPWEIDYGLGMNLDGTYGILPAVMHSSYGQGNALGELEGVFFITGFSEASEDTVTIGSDTYLVVQSTYRTGRRDYAAIKLG